MKSYTGIIFLQTVLLSALVPSALSQDVSIPDPGLNAAIRATLHVVDGQTLTEQNLLLLTNLDASGQKITSVAGLEGASNLVSLNLGTNLLRTLDVPGGLPNLNSLDLTFNLLTNVTIPHGFANLSTLIIEENALTNLSLPDDLANLTFLDIENNQIVKFDLPSTLTNLKDLDASFNSLTNFDVPSELTGLETLKVRANFLTNFTLPPGLDKLSELDLDENQLVTISLPSSMSNLVTLDLFFNNLTSLTLPTDLVKLVDLDLDNNQLTRVSLSSNMVSLEELHLRTNQITSFTLPAGMTALSYFDIGENQLTNITLPSGLNHLNYLRISGNKGLTSLTLPSGMTNLIGIFLRYDQITNLTLPPDLISLTSLDVLGNQLTNIALPPGLTSLAGLYLSGNQLVALTLPPDMMQLILLDLESNPLGSLVLPGTLASANLAETVASLQSQGISVFTYPLTPQFISSSQPTNGLFSSTLAGPPDLYIVQASADLRSWTNIALLTNSLGSTVFNDDANPGPPQKFYRALRQTPFMNMVLISSNTFTMGSPIDEIGRSPDEGPQTIVTLSHSFWMSKFLVTQRDYASVIGSNPSGFPGDLDRPVESVTWLDATNYCAKLTQRDLETGRIPAGFRYRLPTEAEWECAARAGTSTRFYYGDDPAETSLSDYAWYEAKDGVTTHPVGQKTPNAWGLYDMEGNVWEWCQDWYGPYAGGSKTDPQGPSSNLTGVKVIRGGAWESFVADCRSARRSTEAVSPFISDYIIGFRVVLGND